MKYKQLLAIITLLPLILGSCGRGTPAGVCRIHGIVRGPQYEGKKMYLVPLTGARDAAHVDSTRIKDGKFEFTKDTAMMATVIMDYHYRFGLQTLLVVTEPGDVRVVIDSVSSAGGTPQNDRLQQWKVRTEQHRVQTGLMRRAASEAFARGDSAAGNSYRQRADSVHLAYKQFTRQLARQLGQGVLHDFLHPLFPTTYQRKLPDGSVVEMDADTHQPLAR